MNNRFASIVCATALAAAFTVALPEPAHAHQITPPPVPDKIRVQEGSKAFLQARGVGTQNYICLPSGDGFRFVLSSRRPPCSRSTARRSLGASRQNGAEKVQEEA